MKYHILAFGAGFLLDQLFGDPYFPVSYTHLTLPTN